MAVTSGISVAVRIEGVRRTLPPGLELAGYRVVQEALTNVARHAPQSEETVRLRYEEDVLEIDVSNTTSPEGPASGGAGLGLVGHVPDLAVVGEAVDGREAIEITRRLRPDVVLMDVRMPNLDGIEATAAITSDPEATATKVLVLTTFDLDDYVFAALRAGASGFLLKDVTPEGLVAAVRVVAAGDALLSPSVTRPLISEFVELTPRRPQVEAVSPLTDREVEVLRAVRRGLTNDEIGRELHISPSRAKTHVSRILMKLGARDRCSWWCWRTRLASCAPATLERRSTDEPRQLRRFAPGRRPLRPRSGSTTRCRCCTTSSRGQAPRTRDDELTWCRVAPGRRRWLRRSRPVPRPAIR